MANSADASANQYHDFLRFLSKFVVARGALSTVVVSLSISLAIGSTVAVVPELLSDRYARLHHHYDDITPCSDFDDNSMPMPCRRGADDAQNAAAWAALLQNLLTLFLNPIIGRLSDVYGRRWAFVISTFLYTWAPTVLVLMQQFSTIDPIFYYLTNSLIGAISFLGIVFAILSDTIPPEFRTSSFGVIMATFYGGFALSPVLATWLNHLQVSILSMGLVIAAFFYALVVFPETLPESVIETNHSTLREDFSVVAESNTCAAKISSLFTRQFECVAILNRNLTLRLLAVGSFFSSVVYATDTNLVIFYIEDHLNVREKDIAHMFFVMGLMGVLFQAVLLQPLIGLLGDKKLLVLAFASGTFHNFLYGAAKNKKTIYLALCFSQLTKTNFPVLASLASKGASMSEQGGLQGALFAVNSLSAAIGPLSMQFIYNLTKDTLGPGTMFLFASFLYLIGTVVVSFIPVHDHTDEMLSSRLSFEGELEEPLLEDESSSRPQVKLENDGLDQA